MDDIRELAEQRLKQREAKQGPVQDRERYILAAMRGIEHDRAATPAPQTASKVDKRPYCATCDGNGWVDSGVDAAGYAYVKRCSACDHGRVTLRAELPAATPELARAHIAIMREQLSRLKAKQDVRHLA